VTTGKTSDFLLFFFDHSAVRRHLGRFLRRRWSDAPRVGHHPIAAIGVVDAANRPEESMNQTMGLKDVAALLGVKAYRIEYLLAHGLVPEPSLRISGRRVFMPEDVKRLAVHFGVTLPSAETAAEPVAEPIGV